MSQNNKQNYVQPYNDTNKGNLFKSFDPNSFKFPHHSDELWRFTPLKIIHSLQNNSIVLNNYDKIDISSQSDIVVEQVERSDKRIGEICIPSDQIAAKAFSLFKTATIITIKHGIEISSPIEITINGPGFNFISYGHLQVRLENLSKATIIIDLRGSGTYVDNIEIILNEGANLKLIWIANWNYRMANLSFHHTKLNKDAKLEYTNLALGGSLIRTSETIKFTGSGAHVDMRGAYFANNNQFIESRILVDHSHPNCKSNILYKGVLQKTENCSRAYTHTVWVGDILIRNKAKNTKTFEANYNLMLTKGTRADSVPNLEIETGEIIGAGHASTTGNFDYQQIFYLQTRGISKEKAKRLIIHGFFDEIFNKNTLPNVVERIISSIEKEFVQVESKESYQ